MACDPRLIGLLLLAAALSGADGPPFAFRAEALNLSLRRFPAGGPPTVDYRLTLVADQPSGCQVLRAEAPRFRTVGTDTGERLAVLIRPAGRVQEVANDRGALRDRVVRLALDLTPPRLAVSRLLALQGGVRVRFGVGPPRQVRIPLLPLPALPVPVEGLAGVAVQVEELKNGKVALVIPAELADRLGDPAMLDADGVAIAARSGQRNQPEGQPLRIQFDLAGGVGACIRLPWYPEVRSVEAAIRIPDLLVPGGLPGIGDAAAAPPRRPLRAVPRSPLHRSVHDGDVEAIDRTLRVDPGALERPEADLRPAQLAALLGRAEALDRLLAAGAELSVRTRDGRSLLALAAESGDPATVALLLDRGLSPCETAAATGWTLLHQAVNADAPAVLRLLLDAGLDPWAEARDGRSAIDLARDQQRWPLLRAML